MKKIISIILALALAFSFTACGSTSSSQGSSSAKITLKVGASPSPHAEILEKAKEILAQQVINLEIVEFTDYVVPNTAVEEGELDANFFQHVPYMDWFNSEHGTHLVSVTAVHFEPLGIYPGKSSDLSQIKDGAVISVPNDGSNEARALLLLESQGIIKLKKGAGLSATTIDIVENPHNVKIVELEAAQLVPTLPDVDFAVINGNYAVDGGILETVLATEAKDGEAAQLYANILATKEGSENNEAIKALAEALNSDEIRDFINERYSNLFVPAF